MSDQFPEFPEETGNAQIHLHHPDGKFWQINLCESAEAFCTFYGKIGETPRCSEHDIDEFDDAEEMVAELVKRAQKKMRSGYQPTTNVDAKYEGMTHPNLPCPAPITFQWSEFADVAEDLLTEPLESEECPPAILGYVDADFLLEHTDVDENVLSTMWIVIDFHDPQLSVHLFDLNGGQLKLADNVDDFLSQLVPFSEEKFFAESSVEFFTQ